MDKGLSLKKTLFLSELYAPLKSGSANMFFCRFNLYPPDKVIVLTSMVENVDDFDEDIPYEIRRVHLRWYGPKGFEWVGLAFDLFMHGFGLICKHRFEVIQCARPLPEGIAGYLLAKICSKKLVINSHGEDIAVMQNFKAERFLMKSAMLAADLNLANSSFTESLIKDLCGPKAKTAIVYPGFNPCQMKNISAVNVSQLRKRYSDGPILLTVGRLQRRKGQDNVIRSLPEIVSKYPNLQYIIIGSSFGGTEDLKLQLENLAVELGVEQHVKICGEIPDTELFEYYSACDLFLMPARMESNGDVEGFGIVFLEAGCLEKPVIGGNAGGMADAVHDGKTGILVDGHSVKQITEAIMKILSEKIMAKEMGVRGKAFALSMTHEKMFERYCQEMIGRKL